MCFYAIGSIIYCWYHGMFFHLDMFCVLLMRVIEFHTYTYMLDTIKGDSPKLRWLFLKYSIFSQKKTTFRYLLLVRSVLLVPDYIGINLETWYTDYITSMCSVWCYYSIIRKQASSLKKALADLWELAFSYQVNPLAAVQSLPTATHQTRWWRGTIFLFLVVILPYKIQ